MGRLDEKSVNMLASFMVFGLLERDDGKAGRAWCQMGKCRFTREWGPCGVGAVNLAMVVRDRDNVEK